LQWRAGSSQEYHFVIDSSSQIDISSNGSGQDIVVFMDGVLLFRTLSVTPSEALIGLQIESLKFEIGGESPDELTRRELTRPFRVRFADNGYPIEFEFSEDVSVEARTVIENLVRMFQVNIQAGKEWAAEEVNASGRYTAIYTRRSPSSILKEKQSYFYSVPSSTEAISIVKSEELVAFDGEHDWISRMNLEEVLENKAAQGLSYKVRNRASIELTRSRVASTQPDTRWNFFAETASGPSSSPAQGPPTELTLEQAGKEIESVLATLDTSVGNRTENIYRLRDLILMDGELPSRLLDILRTQELNDRTRADLYLVLQLAGTPEAQAALGSLVVDTGLPAVSSLRAIVALGFVNEPTERTIETLWDTARGGISEGDRRDVSATATLALGTVGYGLRTAEDLDYHALRADLLDGASSASDDTHRAAYLLALGNTADDDPAITRDISRFLYDPAPEVRSAAANTLGRLETEEAGDDLFRSLEKESNAAVRGSITEAMVNWENPPAPAIAWVRNAVQSETDEKSRYNMAVILGKTIDKYPENRVALARLLDSEPSKRIRQQVADKIYSSK
jgi:HEAT repeat protein